MITTLGEWSNLGYLPADRARAWERFDPALVDRTRNLEDLYEDAERRGTGDLTSLPPQQSMQLLFETASARFTHGEVLHTPFSNWVLWVSGESILLLARSETPASC